MKTSALFGLALLLVGCPKSTPQVESISSATGPTDATADVWADDDTGPPKPPKGWRRIDNLRGVHKLRPSSAMAWDDGSLWIGGAAVKIAQYQWVLRIPQFGDATQHVFDPGRVLGIRDDGAGGVATVGVLGGVPEDKAWFGDVDAFGGLSSRQTYLSDGNGALHDLAAAGKERVLVGHIAAGDNGQKGWMILTDGQGRDRWKRQFGDAFKQSLQWVSVQNDVFVSVGYQQDETTDPWMIVVDSEGETLFSKRWSDDGWTTLSTAIGNAKSRDIIALGLRSDTEDGHMDGAGLWAVKVGLDGTTSWDRGARGDLSALGQAVAWKGGAAVAALVGPLGSDRTVAIAVITGDGTISWTTPDLPAGIDLAEVYVHNGALQLVAIDADEWGATWTTLSAL